MFCVPSSDVDRTVIVLSAWYGGFTAEKKSPAYASPARTDSVDASGQISV